MKSHKFIIIGNGILGIHLGRKLKAANQDFIILEKSRNVGGRFASRRFAEFNFNLGVQSFEWDGKFFADEIQFGLNEKDLRLEGSTIFANDRFNTWTKKLALNLPIAQSEIQSVNRTKSGFTLRALNEDQFCCENLIITCPAPQAHRILDDSQFDYLLQTEYEKQIFYMCETSRTDISHPKLNLLYRVAKDQYRYFFFELSKWTEESREDIKNYFDTQLSLTSSFAHKWRYSTVKRTVEYRQLWDGLYLLGDYYHKGLKGSFESAQHFSLI